MGHPAAHHGLGPLDDTLVLRRFRDAGTCCKYTQSGCYTEAVFEQRIWRELTGLGLIFQSMSLRNSVNHMLFLLRGVFPRTATVNSCAEK